MNEIIGKPDIRVSFKKADSKNKEFAFWKAHELNQIEKPYIKDGKKKINRWRVGKNTNRLLIIEIDDPDPKNAEDVHFYCEWTFSYKFHMWQTRHGYHIAGTHPYRIRQDWLYANCLLLNPNLKKEDAEDYMKKIRTFDEELRKNAGENFPSVFVKKFRESGLFQGVGLFDILYTVLGIKYCCSTLRISKKSENDTYKFIK